MNKYISSKKQYDEEMTKGDYLPFEKAEQIAEKARSISKKPYILTKKAVEIISAARFSANKNGKIKPGDRLIDGMKEVGVNFYQNNIPEHYRIDMGGFDASEK